MISKYSNQKEEINMKEIEEAAEEIRKGNLVLFPTETVYGLGANALDEKAAKKIFEAKNRAADNPLIVHVANMDMMKDIVIDISPLEKKLMEKFWAGPLTIILKRKSKKIIPDIVTANLDTVAVRMPSNEIAKLLIEKSGVPIIAPSANKSGKPSGTQIEDIIDELDGKVSYILDGGITDIGVESTVVKVKEDTIEILRPGKITKEQLQEVTTKVELDKHILGEVEKDEIVESPGMKYRHYAPNTKCMLVYSQDEKEMIQKINEITKNLQQEQKKVLILGKKENLKEYIAENKWNMGQTLEEIAKNIFSALREADKKNAKLIIIQGTKRDGLGLGIMNRLIRACEDNVI